MLLSTQLELLPQPPQLSAVQADESGADGQVALLSPEPSQWSWSTLPVGLEPEELEVEPVVLPEDELVEPVLLPEELELVLGEPELLEEVLVLSSSSSPPLLPLD